SHLREDIRQRFAIAGLVIHDEDADLVIAGWRRIDHDGSGFLRVHEGWFMDGTNSAYYTAGTSPRPPTGERALTVHGARATLIFGKGDWPCRYRVRLFTTGS